MRRICAAIGIAVTASLVALSYDARTVSISKTRERDFELQLSTRNWRAGHETGLVTKGSPWNRGHLSKNRAIPRSLDRGGLDGGR